MEKGGVFLFDLNTPYKHERVLGDNAYTIEAPDARCDWQNHYDPAGWVDMQLTITDLPSGQVVRESLREYSYSMETVRAALDRYGFTLVKVSDGEDFRPGAAGQPAVDLYCRQALHAGGNSMTEKRTRPPTCCGASRKMAASCFTASIPPRSSARRRSTIRPAPSPRPRWPPADRRLDDGHDAEKPSGFHHAADQGRRPRRPAAGGLGWQRQRQGLCAEPGGGASARHRRPPGCGRRGGTRRHAGRHPRSGDAGALHRPGAAGLRRDSPRTSPSILPSASRCPPSARWACWSIGT